MTQVAPPIKKPTLPTLTILLESMLKETMGTLNCVKIGVIEAFYPGDADTAPTVDVKIAITQVTSVDANGNRTYADYPELLTIPVSFQQGGGCIHTFPIAAGDECLVLFNDVQIDAWVQSGAGQPPPMNRTHDFSDAIAIVGVRSNPRGVAGISATTSQLRSIDGSTIIELDPSGQAVNITAPGGVNVSAPFIKCTGDVLAGDDEISLVHHVHDGVQSGGSNTGEPVP